MSEEWFAGAGDDKAAGLDADYAFVVRRWVRAPERRPWGDVDYGESAPVIVCSSEAVRDAIIAAHNGRLLDVNPKVLSDANEGLGD